MRGFTVKNPEDLPLIKCMPKILIIDDDTAVLKFCHTLLTESSYQVFTAASLQQGLFLIDAEKPDLVLVDLQMPGESDISALETILGKYPGLPVAVFSGFITPDIEKSAFQMGAKDVLGKNLSNMELRGRIAKLIQPARQAANISRKGPSAGDEKILIVDDDPSVRSLLLEFLRAKKFTVIEASSGAEAIEKVKLENPALVLLDVTMPGMSGIETLKKIREFNQEIGVVMATANEDEDTAKKAAELGSYQYVLKPFDLKYLELVVLTRLFMA